MTNNIVILLTACVNPNGMANTALQDASIRKRQYIEAIDFYLRETDCNIVFCENTDTYIFDEITSPEKYGRVEYLTFKGNDYDKSRGKSYGESQIMKYAIRNSTLINTVDFVCKITGRVKIRNINDILHKYDWSLLTNNHVMVNFSWNHYANSVCFVAPHKWLFQTLKNYDRWLDDKEQRVMEVILYNSIINTQDIKILDCFPDIDGIRGTSNDLYKKTKNIKLNHNAVLCAIYKARGDILMYIYKKIRWLFYVICYKLKKYG